MAPPQPSYAVETGECLARRLPEEAEIPFQQWLKQHKGEVLRAWEKQDQEKYYPKTVPARAVR